MPQNHIILCVLFMPIHSLVVVTPFIITLPVILNDPKLLSISISRATTVYGVSPGFSD